MKYFKATILRPISMQEDTKKPLDRKANYVTYSAGDVIECHESFRERFEELRSYVKIEEAAKKISKKEKKEEVLEDDIEEIVEEETPEEIIEEDEESGTKPRTNKK